MSKQKVRIDGYPNAEVVNYGITIDIEASGRTVLELYPSESKRLRKALKRAELETKAGRL